MLNSIAQDYSYAEPVLPPHLTVGAPVDCNLIPCLKNNLGTRLTILTRKHRKRRCELELLELGAVDLFVDLT